MANIDDDIRSLTESFATDLAGLVRRAALESVQAALGGGGHAAVAVPALAAVKRGRGRPRKSPAPVAAPAKAAAPASKAPAAKATAAKASKASAPAAASRKPAAAKRPLGAKRPPAELVKLTEKLGEYIKANPGLGMEVIGKALGSPTKDLNLPVKKLLAAKKIRVEGQKRATEYFPA